MKFVILVKATKASEVGTMPSEEGLAGVLAYNQELVRAGVMRDGVGLSPTSEGFRIRFSAEGRTVIEGPFDDENLVAGYWLIEVASRDEAMRWAMKIPNTAVEGEYGEIEVRRVFELDEFEPGPAVEGFRELEEMESIAKDVQRTRPDLSGAVAPNGTVTVLFTDIEGSTQLTEDLGDREWMEVLRKHNEIVREQLALHSGFEVKSQGDGFMLAFSSARDALRCARGFQRAVAESDSNADRRFSCPRWYETSPRAPASSCSPHPGTSSSRACLARTGSRRCSGRTTRAVGERFSRRSSSSSELRP